MLIPIDKMNFSIIKRTSGSKAVLHAKKIINEIAHDEIVNLLYSKLSFHTFFGDNSLLQVIIYVQNKESLVTYVPLKIIIGSSRASTNEKRIMNIYTLKNDIVWYKNIQELNDSVDFNKIFQSATPIDISQAVNEYPNIKTYLGILKDAIINTPATFTIKDFDIESNKKVMENAKKTINSALGTIFSHGTPQSRDNQISVYLLDPSVFLMNGESFSQIQGSVQKHFFVERRFLNRGGSFLLAHYDNQKNKTEKTELAVFKKRHLFLLQPEKDYFDKNFKPILSKEISFETSLIKEEVYTSLNKDFILTENFNSTMFTSKLEQEKTVDLMSPLNLFTAFLSSVGPHFTKDFRDLTNKHELISKIHEAEDSQAVFEKWLIQNECTSIHCEQMKSLVSVSMFPHLNLEATSKPIVRLKSGSSFDIEFKFFALEKNGRGKGNRDIVKFLKEVSKSISEFFEQAKEKGDTVRDFQYIKIPTVKENSKVYPNKDLYALFTLSMETESYRPNINIVDLQVIRDLATAFLKDVPAADCQEMQELARLNEDDFKKHEMLITQIIISSELSMGAITQFSQTSLYENCGYDMAQVKNLCLVINKTIVDYLEKILEYMKSQKIPQNFPTENDNRKYNLLTERNDSESISQSNEEIKEKLKLLNKIDSLYKKERQSKNDITNKEKLKFIEDLKNDVGFNYFEVEQAGGSNKKNFFVNLNFAGSTSSPLIEVYLKGDTPSEENPQEPKYFSYFVTEIISSSHEKSFISAFLSYIKKEQLEEIFSRLKDLNQNTRLYLQKSEEHAMDVLISYFPEFILLNESQKGTPLWNG